MEGKKVLIKSVLQAVPTYPMGCFKLAQKTCSKLTSIATVFWWGSAEGKRKVPWISWDRMCVSKRGGGMGFRNYGIFNQALLAKQAWRILTVPSSLCARVLQARYYKNGGFLTAGCPKAASFTWKSILHGRDLLKEGLVWHVGDGKKIDVWADNWIPRAGSIKPLGHKPRMEIRRVEEALLDAGQGWNESRLREVFFDGDIEDILKIPVGRAGTEDYLAWNYTKNGIFSVRSAYHLKMHLNSARSGAASSSSNIEDHRGLVGPLGGKCPWEGEDPCLEADPERFGCW
jgi:hypothetical protein